MFKLNIATGQETVLYAFVNGSVTGPSNGCGPTAGVIRDEDGNLYGTTSGSVVTQPHHICSFSKGTVYKLDSNGKLTVLHAFDGIGEDSGGLDGGVTRDSKGRLYGLATGGGSTRNGSVFEIIP